MKKLGFTLIELLAVIVILAIIAIISVPTVMKTIEDSKKGSFKNGSHGIMKAAEYNYSLNILKNNNPGKIKYMYSGGDELSIPNGYVLDYKGQKPKNGEIIVNDEGQVSLAIYDGTYYATKSKDSDEIEITTVPAGECVIVDTS